MHLFPILFCLLFSSIAAAGENVEGEFGDWSKVCFDEGENRVCRIAQVATQNESGKQVFQTAVGYVSDNAKPIVFLTGPLGMFLPRGITLKVSEDSLLTSVVQRCDNSGCLALSELEPEFVELLKKSKEAVLIFGVSAEQNMSIPLSLSGFTKAFDSLGS